MQITHMFDFTQKGQAKSETGDDLYILLHEVPYEGTKVDSYKV